ncbi:glycoside hydrolase family 5 protein [Patescibacteria group bacterium]|nr:glycoside hydrolase family 5 protein [Patescibacteria group bacterium]
MKRGFFLVILAALVLPSEVFAVYDPTSVPNNRFGIHIADTNNIPEVPALVNSTGGDWGYVTLVIPDSDRNTEKWQKIFNILRRSHLIPIVRLATHSDGPVWIKPSDATLLDWVSFLGSLNWPTANRYVVVYNEPNHANEWGGQIDPEGYADILSIISKELKASSPDYFILPAGLDASAPSGGESMDEAAFLRRMVTAIPDIFSSIDGWTSHAYPNPEFSGSPYAEGRGTLTTYRWEEQYLHSLGLTRQLPVFITETGWVHDAGIQENLRYLTSDQIGRYLLYAAGAVWNDPSVVAVTPFVFSYQGEPFDHFSFKEVGGDAFYPQYYAYRSIPKVSGEPLQHERFDLREPILPPVLIADSVYTVTRTIANTGQSILDEKDGYSFSLTDPDGSFQATSEALPYLEPEESGTLTLSVKTPKTSGVYRVGASLTHHGYHIPVTEETVRIVPPPSLTVSARLGWRKTSTARGVTVLLYKDTKLLQKFTGLTLRDGRVTVSGITGIIPREPYRVVILVPYYLPRQAIIALQPSSTVVTMRRMLPLDFDRDGAFTLRDIMALLRKSPKDILPYIFSP